MGSWSFSGKSLLWDNSLAPLETPLSIWEAVGRGARDRSRPALPRQVVGITQVLRTVADRDS